MSKVLGWGLLGLKRERDVAETHVNTSNTGRTPKVNYLRL